jgi:glyoxylase-like metal-dependent hydrolase (beta-lactamase superfamily II)
VRSEEATRERAERDPSGKGEPMLTQVADGVWVRQSEWVSTNSIVVRGEDGLILVDPGIDGSELNQLADDLDPVDARLGPDADWLSGAHQSNLMQAQGR